MPQFLVTTRPERTGDDMAADRKAANAFFARYAAPGSPRKRDRDALIRFYSYDWNLMCCVMEASQWSQIHADDTAAHRTARRAERATHAALNDFSARDDSQLRPYVHAATTQRMQAAGVMPRPVGERLTARGQADRFWALCQNPTAKFRAAVRNDNQPFSQWLLLHPDYGPLQDAPEGYSGTRRLPKAQRFVPGSVRPAGISYDRALEIALAALDKTNR
jgi:hypothetical protein